jgi:hypothetical protein
MRAAAHSGLPVRPALPTGLYSHPVPGMTGRSACRTMDNHRTLDRYLFGVPGGLGTAGPTGSITFGDSGRRRGVWPPALRPGPRPLPGGDASGAAARTRSPPGPPRRHPTARPARRQMAPRPPPASRPAGLSCGTRSATTGDPGPDTPASRDDRERGRPPGNARAAVPQPIAGQRAHQQDGGITRTGALAGPSGCNADGPAPVCPPAFPAARVPGNRADHWAAARVRHARLRRSPHARTRRQRGLSVAVRETADGAHRPS